MLLSRSYVEEQDVSTAVGTPNETTEETVPALSKPLTFRWALTPCVRLSSSSLANHSSVHVTGGSTDVRVYTGVYDSCNGVTYGINGDSAGDILFPGQSSRWSARGSTVSTAPVASGASRGSPTPGTDPPGPGRPASPPGISK
ncbi:hypothetical protein GCM10009665_00250 [Kitasatospora nipponensis]|uniref:Uncharacterized protein n=1 Tax=Kitasatospora nipponensis TaxID=258049 RepID=A0ABN1VJU3_9ACTN